jgi:hypothetical protein
VVSQDVCYDRRGRTLASVDMIERTEQSVGSMSLGLMDLHVCGLIRIPRYPAVGETQWVQLGRVYLQYGSQKRTP